MRWGEEAGGPARVCRGLRGQTVQGTPDTPLPLDSNLSASRQIPHHGGDCAHRCVLHLHLRILSMLSPTPGHSQLSPGGARQLPSQFPQLSCAPSLLPSPSEVCQSDCYFSVQNLQWNWILEDVKGLSIISGGIVDLKKIKRVPLSSGEARWDICE